MNYSLVELERGPSRVTTRGVRQFWQPVGIDSPSRRNWLLLGGGKALMWHADPISDQRVVKIASDGKERMAVATRQAMRGLWQGRDFGPDDVFADSLAEILKTRGLRPSKRRSRYEVLLGPDPFSFWSEFAPPRKNTIVYADTFDRANSGTVGTSSDGLFTWDVQFGTAFAINTNQLVATNITGGTAAWMITSADCDTDENFAEISCTTFTRASGTDLKWEIGTSMSSAGTSGYVGLLGNFDNTAVRELYRLSDETILDTDATATTTATCRTERDGSSIILYVGGVAALTATDTAEATGAGNRRASMFCFSDENSTNDLAWNNFTYGDLTAAVANRRRRVLMAA